MNDCLKFGFDESGSQNHPFQTKFSAYLHDKLVSPLCCMLIFDKIVKVRCGLSKKTRDHLTYETANTFCALKFQRVVINFPRKLLKSAKSWMAELVLVCIADTWLWRYVARTALRKEVFDARSLVKQFSKPDEDYPPKYFSFGWMLHTEPQPIPMCAYSKQWSIDVQE